MVMALAISGMDLNLKELQFNSKKRILEKFGYDVENLDYSKFNFKKISKLYALNKAFLSRDEFETFNSKLDLWLAGEDNVCTDGKDDGQISIISKMANFYEGKLKTVVGSIHSLLTNKKKLASFVITASTMAALTAFGGPVGMAIVIGAGLLGAGKLIVNGIKDFIEANKAAKNAKTDTEAKAAYEQMGSGAFQAEVGVVCAAQAASSAANIISTRSFPPSPAFEEEFVSNLEDISVLADKS